MVKSFILSARNATTLKTFIVTARILVVTKNINAVPVTTSLPPTTRERERDKLGDHASGHTLRVLVAKAFICTEALNQDAAKRYILTSLKKDMVAKTEQMPESELDVPLLKSSQIPAKLKIDEIRLQIFGWV